MKCLSIQGSNNMKNIGAGDSALKREERNYSTSSQDSPTRKDRQNSDSDKFNAKEVEEVVFECINCSG